jgi:signal transduction histidine kinase
LSPHILKNFGLKTAIQKFCDKIQKSSKINIDINVGIDSRLAEEIEVTFYRVVIELLNNTVKHANASKTTIELAKYGNTIVLNYSDNGIGYKLDELLKKSKGMGLFNIKSRIESLNGELNFSSVPLEKTELKINVPL